MTYVCDQCEYGYYVLCQYLNRCVDCCCVGQMPHEATVDHFLKTPVTLSHDVHLDSSDAEVNVYDAAGFERQRSSDGADHVLHLRPGKPDRDAMPDDDEFNSDDSETSGRQLDLL